jgi:hypothetical protein
MRFRLFENRVDLSREVALQSAVDAVMAHLGRDDSGERFPAAIEVVYEVSGPGRGALQAWVAQPDFAQQVQERVVNRLARSGPEVLPALDFEVVEGEADRCFGREVDKPVPVRFVLEPPAAQCPWRWRSAVFSLPPSQRVFSLGRGAWRRESPSGGANDIALPSSARFVSRRAARIERLASRLLVIPESGQRRFLVAERADGGRVLPDPAGRLVLRAGDRLLLFGSAPEFRLALVLEA